MSCKLSFDDPNRESIIDSYLDAISDKGAGREMKKCKNCKYYSPAALHPTIDHCRNESVEVESDFDLSRAVDATLSEVLKG